MKLNPKNLAMSVSARLTLREICFYQMWKNIFAAEDD